MMVQRMIAVVMILGSSVLTGWATGDIAFPAILGMLGLLGVQRRFTWDIRPERHFITPLLLLLLAILFALHCRYAHVRADQAAAFAWQTISRYFLASMTLILFLRPQRVERGEPRPEDREQTGDSLRSLASILCPSISALPTSLGLFHLANVMAAGQVLLLDDRYVSFRLAELLSVTLVILYAAIEGCWWSSGRAAFGSPRALSGPPLPAGGRPPAAANWLASGLALGLLLLIAINLGWIGGSLLYRHVETINFLPAWLSHGAIALDTGAAEAAHTVGFSTSGKLSSVLTIKEEADSAPALTITGDSNPTYLRAMAFENYRTAEENRGQSEWIDRSESEYVWPQQGTPFGGYLVGRTGLFRLHETDASHYVTIRHEVPLGEALFTPLGTCTVEAPSTMLKYDDDDIVALSGARSRLSYRVGYTTSSSGRAPTKAQVAKMLALSAHLDQARIRQQLVTRIFRGCNTTAEKIEAVTKHFHTNYTYALGLEVPPDRDALEYFLLEASSGYCEYFASGAAMLLRFVNVPTRYVTGFLVTERSDDGRSWIARNMHAHAWAEAWDRERRQWVVVEATTQEGLDDTSLADELTRGSGSGRPFLSRLVESLYEYGLFGVIGQFFASYGLLTGGVLSAVFLATAVVVARRRRLRTMSFALRPLSPDVVAMHRLLAAMDRKIAALGYRRPLDETLHAFAARLGRLIEARAQVATGSQPPSAGAWIADWYRQYADLRYSRGIDPRRIEHLQQNLLRPQDEG